MHEAVRPVDAIRVQGAVLPAEEFRRGSASNVYAHPERIS